MTDSAQSQSRPSLSFRERMSHAVSVGSPRGAILAAADAIGRRMAPRLWAESAPWYVGRAVESFGLPIRVDGAAFDVGPAADQTSFKGLLALGAYETLERYAVMKYLPTSEPVVEFGAAVGVVSCLVNSRLTDPSQHVSVEANPELIPILEKNRLRNHRKFRVVHAAVAYGCTSVEFGISDSIVLSAVGGTGSFRKVTVPVVSLETILADSNFSRCSLVCDIEGAEADLVSREGRVLRECVDTIILEVHPARLGVSGVAQLAASLRELGFTPVWQRGDVWVLKSSRSLHAGIPENHPA